jgi:hypothetical protein
MGWNNMNDLSHFKWSGVLGKNLVRLHTAMAVQYFYMTAKQTH